MKHAFLTVYKDRNAVPFLIIICLFGITAGLFSGVFNNYLHEILSVSKAERGVLEFPREAPGFLLIFIVALFFKMNEIRIFTIALLFSFAGLAGISFLGDSRWIAILMLVLWSCGEHIMMPVRESIAIHMAGKGKEGLALGSISSAGNFGQVIGFYLVPFIAFISPAFLPQRGTFPCYQAIYRIAGVFLVPALVISARMAPAKSRIKRERFYFNRKYMKYYALEMFFGARKQVFITFAPYVLIVNYGMRVETLSLLYGITATLNIIIGPTVGRIIDKLGFRFVIISEAVILIVLCLLYGFSDHLLPHASAGWLVSAVFIADSVLFTAGMARSLYAKSISDSQEELTATLSTGISINHIISIGIAIAGGVLWEKLGVEILFSVSALFGVCYLLYSFKLPRQVKIAPQVPLEIRKPSAAEV